ncbi:MAG: methionyl-tRNA formyltransferase [Burkholderiales bacterium]|nr:methionyl-tRNA formyltransferase [Burkholderiales bacterium]
MRVVFAGTPEFAAVALRALLVVPRDVALEVVAVYTQPDRPAGRGMKLTASAVKQVASAHGLPVLQPPTLRTPEAQAELAALAPDVMLVAAYGLILPQSVLDIPRLGCLNIHASLLPRWRGAAPIHRAILAGDTESGVAIMQMEAGLDTGPVLAERRTAIAARETTGQLHDRIAALGAEAAVDVLRRLARGESLVATNQPVEGVTYAHKITPEEAQIDWSASAVEIDRKIRAFNPVPGAWTTWRGEKLKLWASELVHVPSCLGGEPGTVLASTPAGVAGARAPSQLLVSCAGSVLAVTEAQRAGGRRMPVSAWLTGNDHPNPGERFGLSGD